MNLRHTLATDTNRVRKMAYLLFGIFFLGMGVIGIFVPVWPTTCFMLFAVGCFSKSSRRMHSWMLSNRYFGRHLKQYRESGVVDRKILVVSLLSLWISLSLSLALVSPPVWVALIMLIVGIAVTIHLMMLKVADARTQGSAPEPVSPGWKPRSYAVGMIGRPTLR